MDRLPVDVMRQTALDLPFEEIIKWAQMDARFNRNVYNDRIFWETLYLKLSMGMDEGIDVKNKSIDWLRKEVRDLSTIRNYKPEKII